MTSPAHNSDRVLSEARASLVRQQAGGRRTGSIGKRSAEIRRQHMLRKATRMGAAVGAIIIAALAAGLILDGIGFTGVMLTFLAMVGAVVLFASFPRLKVPEQAKLNRGSARTLVGNTELWLEAQRPALPAPAVQLVDRLGLQLDALGVQLEGLDEKQPAIAEVRKLVGEHLPGVVSAYTSIPRHLRSEKRGGLTPDDQLADSLGRISHEVDRVTRQLAEGQIDSLAVQTRFLDYKYGAGVEE
ncbi:MAG: hypothetical protein ABWZ75_09485 [Novosphingobium sp.]